jgi:5-methylcytosine-specific restriction endonuclease McrA
MPSRPSWSDEQLIIAVKNSNKLSEVIRKLGFKTYGANTRTIKKHIVKLNLDISHFITRKEQLAEARSMIKIISNEDFFTLNEIDRKHIKKRIIDQNLIEYKCQRCSITTWEGEKLSLHLDHINGINNDNRLENLRFLCPNCHSLTDTYCGKKLRGKAYSIDNHCIDCHKIIFADSTRCRSCAKFQQPTRIAWPKHDQLQMMVDQLGCRGAAKKLGVTDNTVTKRLRNHLDD